MKNVTFTVDWDKIAPRFITDDIREMVWEDAQDFNLPGWFATPFEDCSGIELEYIGDGDVVLDESFRSAVAELGAFYDMKCDAEPGQATVVILTATRAKLRLDTGRESYPTPAHWYFKSAADIRHDLGVSKTTLNSEVANAYVSVCVKSRGDSE